jgi:hypothetical protein
MKVPHYSKARQLDSALTKSNPISIPLNRVPVAVDIEINEGMVDKYFDLKTHFRQRTQRLLSKD